MEVGPPTNPEQKAIWKTVTEIMDEDDDLDVVWGALHSLLEEELPVDGFPLRTISKDLQQTICLHFIPEMTTATPNIAKLHKALGLRCSAVKLNRLVELWSCNSLDHTTKEDTSILSLAFALMNHACMPTVSWYVQGSEVILRANADLEAGTEINVSYLEDFELQKPTKRRQEHIIETGKEFTCGCARCSGPERCRRVVCARSGCPGLIALTCELRSSSPCEKCGKKLTAKEHSKYVDMETELEQLMEDFFDEEDYDEEGESDIEGPISKPEARFKDLEQMTPKNLDKIKKNAGSLAPAGHWLAHRAQGLFKDVAWSRKSCPSTILECLHQRAAYVRQAFPTVAPSHPPIVDHGLELLEAGELLLKSESAWPSKWTEEKRQASAEVLLQEAISVLEPMRGSENVFVRKARKYLASLNGDGKSAKRRKVDHGEEMA
jgi:hypothetical protein